VVAPQLFHRITESQNGRGWKGPLWSSSPTLLPKQGHLQQAAQDLVHRTLFVEGHFSRSSLMALDISLGNRVLWKV